MFNNIANYKASIFISFLTKINLKPSFTVFVPYDFFIEAYAKSLNISVDFLLKSPSFLNIIKNHITYDKLIQNKKTKFTTLSNTSFVFNSTGLNPVIDDVRGDHFGIKLQNKVKTKQFTAFIIKGILIQNQAPFSFLEDLPKDPFQHLILVGDFKSKDILQLCNLSDRINIKCTDALYVSLLKRLNIEPGENPKATYTEFASNPLIWMIKNHHDKAWDWDKLSYNPSITWQFVQQNPDKNWNWYALSRNPSTTWQFVQSNPDKNWNWYNLSRNSNITWQIVQQNPNKKWNWTGLSSNPNITWQIVQDNPNKPWNWSSLSENPSITWEDIIKNPDKDWNWDELSKKIN